MPSFPPKPRKFLAQLLVAGAMAMLLIPVARAGDEDQQAYCKYVTQQAAAQRDLLRTPDAVAGVTQPNTGLPTQVVWGLTGSLSNVRKAALTMDAARKDCELYTVSSSAQQAVQYAIPSLEKQALQNRLVLIQQASENLDALVAATTKMVEAHNMTRPMAFALESTKIKLAADRADTQSKMVAIYVPQLSDKPVKDLVAEKQASEDNERRAIYKINRQNDWDVALSVGAHQQVNPLIGSPGAYGEVTVSYNLASHAINKHLDQAAASYRDWKKVQEGDVFRNAEILRQQLVDSVSVEDNRLKASEEQQKQIETNLELLGRAETSAALDFGNQLSTAKLLLQIEIGDAAFRLDQLKEFLRRNF
jgi:hypothetical protein